MNKVSFLFLLAAVVSFLIPAQAQETGRYSILLQCSQMEDWCRPISVADTGTEAQFGRSSHTACANQESGVDCTVVAARMKGCFHIGFVHKGELPYLPLDRRTPQGFGATRAAVEADCHHACTTFHAFGCTAVSPA